MAFSVKISVISFLTRGTTSGKYPYAPLPFYIVHWFFSQLITRIGIRKHIEGGERYTVLYTDDFNPDFISRIDSHFNKNTKHSNMIILRK